MSVFQHYLLFAASHFGYLLAALTQSVLVAVVWLVICKRTSLRRNLRVLYGVAMVLAFIPPFVTIDGPNAVSLIGALSCDGLLVWEYKRAQRKSLASTDQTDKKE